MNAYWLQRLLGVTVAGATTLAACSSGRIPEPISDGISDDPDDPSSPGAPGTPTIPDAGKTVVLGPVGAGPNGGAGAPTDLRFVAATNSYLFGAGFCNGEVGFVPTVSLTPSEITVGGGSDCIVSADPQPAPGTAFLAAVDSTTNTLLIASPPTTGPVGATATLAGTPSLVRVVNRTEAWVSEPQTGTIEVFTVSANFKALTKSATITTAVGAVGLTVDGANGAVYTAAPSGGVIVISSSTHQVMGTWPTGCAAPGGLEVDSTDDWVFAGCTEGTVVVLDAANNGTQLATLAGTATTFQSADSLAFEPAKSHLYVASGVSGSATVLSVSPTGGLKALGSFTTEPGAACVATDGLGTVFVCAPAKGGVLFHRDLF